jgi:hypothetical protein
VALAGCGLLAKLTISGEEGEGTDRIKRAVCSGSSFEVGAIVQYEGRPCRVTTGVNSNDSMGVRACGAVVTMEAGMTELDVSGKGLGAAGAAVVTGFLPRCTALVSANLLCNGIGTEQAAVLAAVAKEHGTLESVCGLRGSDTVVDMSGKGLGAEDVVLLAGELESMEGLTELDLRHAALGKEGAAAVVVALAGCGLLAKITISGEDKGKETGWIKRAVCSGSSFEVGAIVQYEGRPCRATRGVDSLDNMRVRACGAVVTMEAGMTELDVSGKGLGASGAAVVAGFLPRCTALVSANLLCNGIGTEQAAALAAVVQAHGTLVSVCGLRGSETAVDMSGTGLGAEDVVLLAGELESMEGLTELDLRGTRLGAAGAAVVAGFLPRCTALVSANLLCNGIGTEQAAVLAAVVQAHGTLVSVCGLRGSETAVDMSGKGLGAEDVVLLAGELESMEGLTELDLRGTRLGAAGAAVVAGFLPRCNAGLTELDLSCTGLGAAGAAVVAGFLPRCTALVSANLASNNIGGYLKKGKFVATPEGPAAIASAMKDSGFAALSELNMSNNNIATVLAGKAFSDTLKGNSTLKKLDVSANTSICPAADASNGTDGTGFAKELLVGLKENQGLSELILFSNGIGSTLIAALKGCLSGKGDAATEVRSADEGKDERQPPRPVHINHVSRGVHIVNASWASPANDEAVEKYQILWSGEIEGGWADSSEDDEDHECMVPGDQHSMHLDLGGGVGNGKNGVLRARARNSVGWGEWGAAVAATTSDTCFHPRSRVSLSDGSFKQVQHIQKGDLVLDPSPSTPSGSPVLCRVECVIKSHCATGSAEFVELSESLLITPWHPVRIDGKWRFPCKLAKPKRLPCDAVYNFVLSPSTAASECQHSMCIGGIECVTLGHHYQESTVRHPYFGSQLVVNDLKRMNGWQSGLVELAPGALERNPSTGLACGMKLEKEVVNRS